MKQKLNVRDSIKLNLLEITKFIVSASDIFTFTPDYMSSNTGWDIVLSIGVLHHTENCRLGIAKACQLTKSGGYVLIGLYNRYGRLPFLEYFNEMKARNASEQEMYQAYTKMDNRHQDETAAMSWFKDQVLHPHETLHTLSEVIEVFNENNVFMEATSINGFQPYDDNQSLYDIEKKLYDKGLQFIQQEKYYSGLFIVAGKKQ